MERNETEIRKEIDFIKNLHNKCMESLAEKIFSQLDVNSLKAAEAVSKLWYSIVQKGKMWEKLYGKSTLKSSTLNQLLHRRICEGFNVQADSFLHKRLLNALEKVKMNWASGSHSKKVVDVGRCTRFLMDTNRIITINSTLSVTMWNRWTLQEERLPLQSDTTLTELTHLELSDDFVFCSYRDGTIIVWDIIAKSVRLKFRDEIMSGCDLKIYAAHGIMVTFVSVIGLNGRYDQTRFCVRSIQTPSDTVAQELTNRIPCSRVKEVTSDNNYFVVFLFCSNDYIVSAEDFKIQIRSVNAFEVLQEIDGVMSSSDIYSYFNGWLVTTAGSTSINVWNISEYNQSKSCQQINILNAADSEYETQIADVQLNGQQLIVRHTDADGTFVVWNLFGKNKEDLEHLEIGNIQLLGERVRRGYQKFRFDKLQIVSVHTHEGSKGRRDLMTMRDFFL